MRRREFVTLLGSATVAAWPLAARAQQPERMRLIGVLMAYAESDAAAQAGVRAFREGLAKLGWKEGSNFKIEISMGRRQCGQVQSICPRTGRSAA